MNYKIPQNEEFIKLAKKLSLFETFHHIHFESMDRYTKDLTKKNNWTTWYTLRTYLHNESQRNNIKQIIETHLKDGEYCGFDWEIWIETKVNNVWKKLDSKTI